MPVIDESGTFNLHQKLRARECVAARPGAHVHRLRTAYESVFPNLTVSSPPTSRAHSVQMPCPLEPFPSPYCPAPLLDTTQARATLYGLLGGGHLSSSWVTPAGARSRKKHLLSRNVLVGSRYQMPPNSAAATCRACVFTTSSTT
jgi:hypothetical protein